SRLLEPGCERFGDKAQDSAQAFLLLQDLAALLGNDGELGGVEAGEDRQLADDPADRLQFLVGDISLHARHRHHHIDERLLRVDGSRHRLLPSAATASGQAKGCPVADAWEALANFSYSRDAVPSYGNARCHLEDFFRVRLLLRAS